MSTTSSTRDQWLAQPDWLAAHLEDPSVRIVDMRGEVQVTTDADGTQRADYRGLRDQYLAGHIPGAIFLDWTADITDPDDPVPAQVAPPERMAANLGAAGIGDDTLVVAYDSHPSSQFATRLWWALRYHGHDRVKVLDGGWKRWLEQGHPTSAAVPTYPPATFTSHTRPDLRATADQVLAQLHAPGTVLIDARDTGQYTNAVRRGPRGGRIPGAISLPRELFVNDDGTFRDADELRAATAAAGLSPEREIIAYCNGGVAATTVLFALTLLDYPRLANYDGSWNEWGPRLELPVEL